MTQEDKTTDRSAASECLRKRAEDSAAEGRYSEALDLYKKLTALHPGDESFLLALAWAYHDCGQMEEAVACFESLLEKELARKVFTGFAFDELVRIFKAQGRTDRLLDICERAAAAQPGDYALLGDLAEACLKAGQAERAAAVYREMIAMEPDSSVVYCALGNVLAALGDFPGVDEAYERAAALEPDRSAAFFGRLAELYRQAGQSDRAERAIRRSLGAAPAEPAYRLLLGDILIAGGKVEEGCQAYEFAVNLKRSSAGAYYSRLGNALARALCHEQAVEAFRKAIAVEPKAPFFYLNLAASYTALGREDLAREAMSRAESLA